MSNSQNVLTHIIAITSPAFQSKACNPNCTEVVSFSNAERNLGMRLGHRHPRDFREVSFHVT